MTYRERRMNRAERLRGWAEKREAKSAAALGSARTMLDLTPMGQPILVGHHSEQRHRGHLARIDSQLAAGFAHADKAVEMSSKADSIEAAAERAIYSDDPDAIEQLERRVAELEAQRARMKAVNAAVRKHTLTRLLEPDPPFALAAAEQAELLQLARLCPYHQVETKGMPAHALSNLAGNIARNRKRLEALRAAAARS